MWVCFVLLFAFHFVGPTAPANFAVYQSPDYPDVISVSWSDPLYVTGEVTSYQVYYKKISDPDWMKLVVPATVTSVDVDKFIFGQSYNVHVIAVDRNGPGSPSKTESIATLFGK